MGGCEASRAVLASAFENFLKRLQRPELGSDVQGLGVGGPESRSLPASAARDLGDCGGPTRSFRVLALCLFSCLLQLSSLPACRLAGTHGGRGKLGSPVCKSVSHASSWL